MHSFFLREDVGNMEKPRLVIFDMDGLMFDTGQLVYRAYLAGAKQYDFSINHSVYYDLTGRRDPEVRKEMKAIYGEHQDIDTWRDAIVSHRLRILDEEQRVYKKKGLLELLSFLKEEGYMTALASSTNRKVIEYYFTIEDMPQCFDYIVAGDEVTQGKPNPEIFLKACKKANVKPKNALVLEDSIVGLQAALHGGMTPFQVPDDITNLPVYEGKHPLLKNPDDFLVKSVEGVQVFKDLLAVRDYLKKEFSYRNESLV